MNRKGKAINDIYNVLNNENEDTICENTLSDLWDKILSEPDKRKRQRILKEYVSRHKEFTYLLDEKYKELIDHEAEAALIKVAVGGVYKSEEISCFGGRKSVKRTKKAVPPNFSALKMLLVSRNPDKYSEKLPEAETEEKTEVRIIDDI